MSTLQIAIDPSIINIQINEDSNIQNLDISVNIAGVSFDNLDVFDESILDILFPWNWNDENDYPTHLRVWFLVKEGEFLEIGHKIDISIKKPIPNNDDLSNIKTFYEKEIKSKIGIKENIIYDYNKISDLQINDNTKENIQGYSISAFSQISQKLFPLNQYLNLVYFSDSAEGPNIESFKGIIALPINQEDVNSKWFLPNASSPVNLTNGMPRFKVNDLSKVIFPNFVNYPNISKEMVMFSPVTAFPALDKEIFYGNTRIRKKGNFDGKVKIKAFNGNDWTSGFFEKIASMFNIPNLVLDYFIENKSKIDDNNFKNIDRLLWDLHFEPWHFSKNQKLNGEEISQLIVNYDYDQDPIKTFIDKVKNEDIGSHFEFLIATLLDVRIQDYHIEKNNLVKTWEKRNSKFMDILSQGDFLIKFYKEFFKDPKASLKNFENINLQEYYCSQISAGCRKELFENINNFDALEIVGGINSYIKKYFRDRLTTNTLNRLPKIKNSVVQNTINFNEFEIYLDKKFSKGSYNFNLISDILEDDKAYLTPPPIRIQVNPLEGLKTQNKEQLEDLSDEISGFLLLYTRGLEKNINKADKTGPWKYCNLTKVNLVEEIANTGLINSKLLKDSYLVPSYLPIHDDIRKISFDLSNENFSLVAGIENSNKDSEILLENNNYINYLLDSEHKPYGFWYGYYYYFNAYAVLNSGTLSPELRDASGRFNVWQNEPNLNIDQDYTAEIQYLRKVTINSPNIKPQLQNGALINTYPNSFRPLAMELNSWNSELKTPHYLLSDDSKFNKEIEIIVERPTTTFWDWYAFLGDTITKPEDFPKNNDIIYDPAVSTYYVMEITQIFPKEEVQTHILQHPSFSKNNYIESSPKLDKIKVELQSKLQHVYSYDANKKIISIGEGVIVEISFYSLVMNEYFDGNELKIHKCIKGLGTNFEIKGKTFTKYGPSTICLETAIAFNKVKIEDLCNNLYHSLELSQNELVNSAEVFITKRSDFDNEFKYGSRLEIFQQIWKWNGRLPFLEQLYDKEDYNLHILNPQSEGETTNAMEWEAWVFSERPDDSSYVYNSNLLAYTNTDRQLVYSDLRINEVKSLYYRFKCILHNRYEFLGGKYISNKIESKINVSLGKEVIFNPWKRLVFKSIKKESLPTPQVKFYLPLTQSIKESKNTNNAAPLLIVLNNKWFFEAGLAEQLEVGIEILKNNENKAYLNAGPDPIIYNNGWNNINIPNNTNRENDEDGNYYIISPTGPIGYSYDFASKNPKINSSAFVLELDDKLLEIVNPLKEKERFSAWTMMRVAVRSKLNPAFWKVGDEHPKLYSSKWSNKTWVQFIQAIDSFVPSYWREEVLNNGAIKFDSLSDFKKIDLKSFQIFDDYYNDMNEWYLIVTKLESDIAGMPVESYQTTLRVSNNGLIPDHLELPVGTIDGYVRIMVVRKKYGDVIQNDVWEQLFGEYKEDEVNNDAKVAMPLITERIPLKINR